MSAPASQGWTDHHCHLPSADEGRELVTEASRAGVSRFVTVGTSLAESRRAIEVANELDDVWATAGVHPHDASDGVDGIEELLGDPTVVAVGECGLDYHYMHSTAPQQRAAFAAQVALSIAHRLPLVIHTREAWDETFDILAAEGVPERVVFHCFTGGPTEARRCLDLDAHLSFSGIVTFPSAPEVREAARLCPIDRMLVETDSPYLAPVPHRGRPNRPALVAVVGEAVAAERGIDPSELATITSQNAEDVYGFDRDGGSRDDDADRLDRAAGRTAASRCSAPCPAGRGDHRDAAGARGVVVGRGEGGGGSDEVEVRSAQVRRTTTTADASSTTVYTVALDPRWLPKGSSSYSDSDAKRRHSSLPSASTTSPPATSTTIAGHGSKTATTVRSRSTTTVRTTATVRMSPATHATTTRPPATAVSPTQPAVPPTTARPAFTPSG